MLRMFSCPSPAGTFAVRLNYEATMTRTFGAFFILLSIFLLAGCGSIEDMIEDATRQEITISRTVHDSTSERNVPSATVVEAVSLYNADSIAIGPVSIDPIADPIEISRLGLGNVKFYVRGDLRNQGNSPAVVTFKVIPNNAPGVAPVTIGTITVPAKSRLDLDLPGDMDQDAETIHATLQGVVHQLDDAYLVNPIIEVAGGGGDRIDVDAIRIAAVPTYWREGVLSPGGIGSFAKDVEDVNAGALMGDVTNKGTFFAEVSVFLTSEDADATETELLAHAMLAPGEKIAGFDMLVDDGKAMIEDAFWQMVNGKKVNFDFVVVSEQPLKVKSNNLRLQAELVVQADVL
jgi:hypothetical protein